jgi:hypothetical protein
MASITARGVAATAHRDVFHDVPAALYTSTASIRGRCFCRRCFRRGLLRMDGLGSLTGGKKKDGGQRKTGKWIHRFC